MFYKAFCSLLLSVLYGYLETSDSRIYRLSQQLLGSVSWVLTFVHHSWIYCTQQAALFVSELPEKDLQLKRSGAVQVVLYNVNKVLCFVYISSVIIQCRQYSTISCLVCLNYLKKISQTCWSSADTIIVFTISCRGLCLNYLETISQTQWFNVGSILISCRGLCVNYLKKISQTWWSSVGSILQ